MEISSRIGFLYPLIKVSLIYNENVSLDWDTVGAEQGVADLPTHPAMDEFLASAVEQMLFDEVECPIEYGRIFALSAHSGASRSDDVRSNNQEAQPLLAKHKPFSEVLRSVDSCGNRARNQGIIFVIFVVVKIVDLLFTVLLQHPIPMTVLMPGWLLKLVCSKTLYFTCSTTFNFNH